MKLHSIFLMSTVILTQAQAFELPKKPVKSYECKVCDRLSQESLQDKWRINNQSLSNKATNKQKSYSYKKKINLEQLQKGIIITTLAPGAVVRITALEDKDIPQLLLQTPQKKTLSLKEASELYSQDELLGDRLVSAKHQTMIQIKPDLGSGSFILKSSQKSPRLAQSYLIHVYDKFSTAFMEVVSDAIHYQYGDKFTATLTFKDTYSEYDIHQVDASLIGPQGQLQPLTIIKVKNNQYEATTLLNSETNDYGENWYLEASILAEKENELVSRNAHLAFSYSIPSASLLNIKKINSKPLTFNTNLEVATASRYSLLGILFKKNETGQLQAVELSQKGLWLEAGTQSIQFSFDNPDQLEEDNLYLGYFRLLDYGQLKPVYLYNKAIKLSKLVD